jgi:long-chain fatty acid transport protein
VRHVTRAPVRDSSRLAALALCALLWAAPGLAQQSLQVPVQFDFLNPSARSLALGSAFVGLADDATAALVNPAGLVALSSKEVSIEGRYRRFTQPFLVAGRLSGSPTGIGQDTLPGPVFDDIVDQSVGASFASFVYPRRSLRLAAFRHELIRVGQDFASIGVFQYPGFDTRDTGVAATRTLKIDSYGGAVAYQLRHLWLGAGAMAQRFRLGFEFDRFVARNNIFDPPDPTAQVFRFTQEGSDIGLGLMAGAMVPLPKGKIGLAYKRGARVDFSSTASGLAVGNVSQTSSATFKVPDTIAVGASALVLNDTLLFTGEYTRVFHSQLRDQYVITMVNRGESADRVANFTIADSNEVHVGVEYIIPGPRHPGIRAGFWYDPDHSVHFRPTPANDPLDERIAAMLSSGKDQYHYTFGGLIGVHPKVDFSAAVDWASRSTLVSASIIWHF